MGLAVFYDANGEFLWRCTGSLISPTVFLTASHCADTVGGAVTARVYFQQNAGANYDPTAEVDPVSGYPEYCAEGTLGVTCATSDEIYNIGYDGQLPAAGTLDSLATARGTKDTVFTVSGYGLTYKPNAIAPMPPTCYRERLMASSRLVNLNSALTTGFNLQTQGNGSGLGGTCNGDSGGPVFLGGFDSNLIVGVTSFGLNSLCRGTDFAYRIDTPEVLAWIQSYL